jgi:hypothetical protein
MKVLIHTAFTLLVFFGLCCSSSTAAEKIMSLCQFQYPSDSLIEWKCVKLTRKDSPYRVFGKQWQDGLRFNRMDRRHFVAGMSVKVPVHMEQIKDFSPMPKSYPEAAKEAKFILIDQNEMFLGAYESGTLVFSTPIAVGVEGKRLQNGSYKVTAVDRTHESSLYPVEGTKRPYPMHYGLRFYIDKREDGWTSYFLHGRDVPGYPASHGCIGLYDEEMQRKYYHEPDRPVLKDAKKLYQWVVGNHRDTGKFQNVNYGPKVLIMGAPSATAAAPPKSATPPTAAAAPKSVAPPAAGVPTKAVTSPPAAAPTKALAPPVAVVPLVGKPLQHP